MKLAWLNPPSGGWASTPRAATNQNNALRRLQKKRQPKEEQPGDGLRRFLGLDPAIAETMERAGLA
ncbi:hypothetical protein NKI30_19460 [Mesorhizobium opportunistum]|uniref:hypothetical protein n=1 Tax=Mesorhizobium opportunistum TaxID=593909 RepID=UPI00333629E5